MVSGKGGIHKVVNNELGRSGDITRDYFLDKRYPQGTTFLNPEKLLKTGRSLKEDSKKNKVEIKREFLDIGEI